MPAIVRSAVLACVAAASLHGGTHEDVIELVKSMAAALTAVNVPEFMDAFDKNMTDYEAIRTNVAALVNQADVASSIEPVSDAGDDTKWSVDLDWYIQVSSLLQDGQTVQRRQMVHCELRKEKKKWKIVSLKPIEFFAPAAAEK
jgi:hypothetical protein